MARAEKIVTDEVKSRMEKGDLGSYDGVLFKNAFRSQSSRISVGSVDLGVVAAAKEELVGLIDKMGTPKVVKGDAFKYYIGSWKGLRIAAVETGHGLDKARRGTEALLQAFRPERVASIGFVKSLVKSLEPGAFFVPNRLLLEDGSELDLSQPKLAPPKGEESADPEAAAPPAATALPDMTPAIPSGRPIRSVMVWAIRIPLMRVLSSSPPFPTMTNIRPRKTPARIPRMFPTTFPSESWSRKNRTMPAIVTRTTPTSFFFIFSRKRMADRIRMKIGAVYWSTMALAAVVSLFATVNKVADKPSPIPANREYRFSLKATDSFFI